jgi:hypothetical protein
MTLLSYTIILLYDMKKPRVQKNFLLSLPQKSEIKEAIVTTAITKDREKVIFMTTLPNSPQKQTATTTTMTHVH